MTKKPRKDQGKPDGPEKKDGDFAHGEAPNTRNDEVHVHGFFTFSGELAGEETRTDVFRGDAEAPEAAPPPEAVAPPPPVEAPEAEAPDVEIDALRAAAEEITETDAFVPGLDVDTDPETRIEVVEPPAEGADLPTETELPEPTRALSYLAPAPDETVDLGEATLTDLAGEEDLGPASSELSATIAEAQEDQTASLPDVAGLPQRAAPDDRTASLSLPPEPKHAPLVVPPPAPLTETKPDPDLEVPAGPAPAPRRARERVRTRGRRLREPRKPLLARVRERLPKLRLKVAFRGIGRALRESVGEIGQVVRPKRAEIRIQRNAEWWRRTVVEIAALFSLVVPIEIVASGGQLGSFGVHPHPYWIIVLPMAGARGVVAGLLAAATASVLYVIGAMQALRPEAFGDLFTYKTMLEPLLFCGVGFFAGELHDELATRYRKLERLVDDVQTRNQRLRQERDVLADANRELERRIVDDSVQFGNMIVAATRIESAGRTEIFEVALELVEEHCGAAASVLLVLEDGSLDHLCHRGWSGEEMAQRLAAARASDFVRRAIAEGRNVNGFQAGESPPESGPLVVAPLFDTSGVAKAILCLDAIPASRLNESTITLFLGIAEWISASLGRLARGEEVEDPRQASIGAGPDADMWMGSLDDLGERLRLELERCSRYGVPASFLAIQAAEWKDTSREGVDVVDRYVLSHFTGGLRPSDSLYRFGYPGCYLLVLAGTTVEGAEAVRARLRRRLEYSSRKEVGRIDVFATGPDAEAPDLLSLAGRVAKRFREQSALPLEGKCPVQLPRETRIGNIDAFLRRLRMEASLAARNGFDLHVVGISADVGGDDDARAARDVLARHLREVGDRVLRSTDGVYSIGPGHCAVVLPSTADEDAALVAHRLVHALRERDPQAPYGDLETQVLGFGPVHPDATSFLEALARRRRADA